MKGVTVRWCVGAKGRRGEGAKVRRCEGAKGRRGEGAKVRRCEGAKVNFATLLLFTFILCFFLHDIGEASAGFLEPCETEPCNE